MAPAAIQAPPATLAHQNSRYVPRGDVSATLNFFDPPSDGSPPFVEVEQQTDGNRNFGDAFVDVTIHDIRNRESDFDLDRHAFQAVSGVSSAMTEADWLDDETIHRVYYPEVVKLILRTVPGSHKVTIFDHTVRRAEKGAAREPVLRVHVDQTVRASAWRVKRHDPDQADELLDGRYRIINVWRSIDGPVQSFPLAYASADTVDHDGDVWPVQYRYPNRTGETAALRYDRGQKFYYWSGMDDDERMFLKCSDSKEGVGKCAAHTAFVDHRTPEGAKRRASIEVRALVYG